MPTHTPDMEITQGRFSIKIPSVMRGIIPAAMAIPNNRPKRD